MASEEPSGSIYFPADSNLFRHAREHYELKKKVEELNRWIYNFKNESERSIRLVESRNRFPVNRPPLVLPLLL